MSIRQRSTQCLGKQVSEKTQSSRLCSPLSRWPRQRFHEENNKLVSNRVASERVFRSRETVKAWLESSPSSVVVDVEENSECSSSFESFNSSPARSVDHCSYTTRSQKTSPGKSRTISPPRSTANRNSVDSSRIDYSHGSFLMLAFKNAQYRGLSLPPAFQYTSEVLKENHSNDDECDSPRSEFSVTSEWQDILAAARMSNSENNIVLETNGSRSVSGNPHMVRKPCRTRSTELPRVARIYNRCASGDLESL
jgi:hypothetical protein